MTRPPERILKSWCSFFQTLPFSGFSSAFSEPETKQNMTQHFWFGYKYAQQNPCRDMISRFIVDKSISAVWRGSFAFRLFASFGGKRFELIRHGRFPIFGTLFTPRDNKVTGKKSRWPNRETVRDADFKSLKGKGEAQSRGISILSLTKIDGWC